MHNCNMHLKIVPLCYKFNLIPDSMRFCTLTNLEPSIRKQDRLPEKFRFCLALSQTIQIGMQIRHADRPCKPAKPKQHAVGQALHAVGLNNDINAQNADVTHHASNMTTQKTKCLWTGIFVCVQRLQSAWPARRLGTPNLQACIVWLNA